MAVETEQEAAESTSRLAGVVDSKTALAVVTGAVLLYVYVPIISLVVFSFNAGGINFPFEGLSLEWYAALFADGATIEAIVRSLQLAAVVTVIGTLLSTATAVAYLYGFPGSRALLYLLVAGIVVPGITFSVGSNILDRKSVV